MRSTTDNLSKEDILNDWFYDLTIGEDEQLINNLYNNGCDLIPLFFTDLEEALKGRTLLDVFFQGKGADDDFSTYANYFYFDGQDKIQSANSIGEMVSYSDILAHLLSDTDVECYQFDDEMTEEENIENFKNFLNDTFLN